MIVCTKCGFQNEDSDTFCGSCAGFLEWSGQQVVEETAEPEPEPEAPVDEEHAGFIERVKDRIGIGETKDDDGAANGEIPAAPVATPPPEPVGGPAPGPPPPPPPAPLTAPDPGPATTVAPVVSPPVAAPTPTPRESAPPAPVAEAPSADTPTAETPTTQPPPPTASPPTATPPPTATSPTQPAVRVPTAAARTSQPVPAQPAPVQPAATPSPAATAPVQPEAVKPVAVKARPTPRSKVAPTRVVNPGDLICGQCGEGNDPARKFCRRCGASLVEAHVFSLPWYRRLWRKLTTRRTRTAGDRPHRRRRMIGGAGPGWLSSWVTRIIVLVVIVAVILAFVGPWKHNIRNHTSRYYHDALNVVHPTYNPVHPVSAVATNEASGHPAAFVIDGDSNTSWQSGKAVTSKTPEALTLTFAGKTNIDKIGFLNGDQDTSGAYLTEPRLHVIRLTTPAPHAYSKTLTLSDTASFQKFTVKVRSSSVLVITIESVYPSGQGTHVALAEVEFFKLSL